MKWTIGKKLIGGFVGVALLVLVAGIIGISNVGKVGKAGDIILDEEVPIADAAMEMKVSLLIGSDAMAKYVRLEDPEELAKLKENFEVSTADAGKWNQAILQGDEELGVIASRNDEVRKLAEEAGAASKAFEKSADKLMETHLMAARNHKTAKILRNKFEANVKEMVDDANKSMGMKMAVISLGDICRQYLLQEDISKLETLGRDVNKRIEDLNKGGSASHASPEESSSPMVHSGAGAMKNMNMAGGAGHAALGKSVEEALRAHRHYLEMREQAARAMAELSDSRKLVFRTIDELEEKVEKGMEAAMVGSMRAQRSARVILSTVSIVGLVAAVLIGLFISRSITRPVHQVVQAAQAIAEGNLSISNLNIKTKDEMGELGGSINRMLDKLNNMVSEVTQNTVQVASAANEIASASEEMAAGAEEQTSQAAQVATAVEEMASTVLEVAKNAASASELAKQSADTAKNGGQVVEQTVSGMQNISDSVSQSAATVGELGKRSDEIGEIIGVIDDIADQTNLLALNAAIEAARAGEQGRGFAVVADEVRKLAERTTTATKEVGNTIKAIQSDTGGAVSSMESGTKEVEEGMKFANQAGSSLSEIVSSADKVSGMIQQIATAADQQSAASEQISKNVEAISTVTKQTATGAQQAATAAQQLNRQAENLQALVGKFKLRSGNQETDWSSDSGSKSEKREKAKPAAGKRKYQLS